MQGGVTYDRFLDRNVVHVEKTPEMRMLYAAYVQGRFVFLPLNPAYTSVETTHFLQNLDAALLVSDEGEAGATLVFRR